MNEGGEERNAGQKTEREGRKGAEIKAGGRGGFILS